jgi:hypothetical protein
MPSHIASLRRPVLAFFVAGVSAAALATPASAATQAFTYTGAPQTWVVPQGVTQATFDLRGSSSGPDSGRGGRATATIPVTPGATVQVNVGGMAQFDSTTGFPGGGGFNGGGNAFWGAGGGGATDIRIGGTELTDRVLVAGGGGGGGIPMSGSAIGGAGGGLMGMPGGEPSPGSGGGQTEGGDGGGVGGNGTFGQGGNNPPQDSGGGGGGGYYGGGAGDFGGGGGGSGYGPAGTTFETGVNNGPGAATVEYVEPPAPNSTPAIEGFSVTPRKFASGGPTKLNRAKAPTVNLTLSEDAEVTFRVRGAPRKNLARAERKTRKVTVELSEGANSLPLEDVLGGKALKPRRYTLKAVATDSAAQRSKPASAKFRVVRP